MPANENNNSKSNSKENLIISLRVQEAKKRDIGRNIARIEKKRNSQPSPRKIEQETLYYGERSISKN